MTLDIAKLAASDVLKTVFLSPFRESLNNELSPVYSMIESGSKNISSGILKFEVETGRSSGTGSIGELDELPTPSQQKSTVGNTGLKYHYGAIALSAQVFELATTDQAVFVNKVMREMDRIKVDLMQDRQRQIWNDADSAIVYASGPAVGQVIPIANATKAQLRAIIVDMELDIGTAVAGNTAGTKLVVTALDRANLTITVVGALGAVVPGSVIRKHNSFGNELTGLREIVGAGDVLYGIDGANEYVWNSYIDDNSANGNALRPLTSLMLQTLMDEQSDEHGTEADVAFTTKSIMRAFQTQLESKQRFTDTLDLVDGYTALKVSSGGMEIGLASDRFAPDDQVTLLTTSDLYFNEAADWQWDTRDGSEWRRLGNTHAWRADMFKFDELTTDARNGHAAIKDIAGA